MTDASPRGTVAPAPALRASAALLLNAFIWGVSWWPFRELGGLGLHSLWATAVAYLFATALVVAASPASVREVLRSPECWALGAAAGLTNSCFNWAVTTGEVVRVVLLFYLMPVWSLLLARLLLGERILPLAVGRVALALAGAAVVLMPAGAGLPLPQSQSDWLAVAGGVFFALNNVLLKRASHRSDGVRAAAMFGGGLVVPMLLAVALTLAGTVPALPAPATGWLVGAALLGLALLCANMGLQYGAARLSANATAVIMLSEIVFAAASAALVAGEAPSAREWAGGALILVAALAASLQSGPRAAAPPAAEAR